MICSVYTDILHITVFSQFVEYSFHLYKFLPFRQIPVHSSPFTIHFGHIMPRRSHPIIPLNGYLARPHMSSLSLFLIPASINCSTIFSRMVCCILSNVCDATSFYQRSINHAFYIFKKNLTLFILFLYDKLPVTVCS